jgi:hypothetical protein
MPNYQGVWNISTQYQNASGWPIPPLLGDLALFTSGQASTTGVYYVVITTTSNGINWGDLSAGNFYTAGMSSSTRGVFAFGKSTGNLNSNVMEYVTMRSLGVTGDFGDAQNTGLKSDSGSSNETRGIFVDGYPVNTISFITIATTGNANDFGDLTQARGSLAGFSSTTRSVFAGGKTPTVVNTIDYVTIASAGNATDFGDLVTSQGDCAGLSSSTRGIIGGGYSGAALVNTIQYVTIGTTGNASDFGDLSAGKQYCTGTSNSTRGVIQLGESVTCEYITIASTGNSTDFGDLYFASGSGAVSTAHGGL